MDTRCSDNPRNSRHWDNQQPCHSCIRVEKSCIGNCCNNLLWGNHWRSYSRILREIRCSCSRRSNRCLDSRRFELHEQPLSKRTALTVDTVAVGTVAVNCAVAALWESIALTVDAVAIIGTVAVSIAVAAFWVSTALTVDAVAAVGAVVISFAVAPGSEGAAHTVDAESGKVVTVRAAEAIAALGKRAADAIVTVGSCGIGDNRWPHRSCTPERMTLCTAELEVDRPGAISV